MLVNTKRMEFLLVKHAFMIDYLLNKANTYIPYEVVIGLVTVATLHSTRYDIGVTSSFKFLYLDF